MKVIPLIRILWRGSRATTLMIVGCATASGIMSAGVVAVVGQAARGDQSPTVAMMVAFSALVLAKIATNAMSRMLLVRLSEDTIMELSLAVCGSVLRAPLRNIEKRGVAQIHTTLTDDVSAVTWAVQCLPMLVTNAAVLAGCVAYMAWLSPAACVAVVVITLVGAASYRMIEIRSARTYWAAREARSRLFGLFGALTGGIKELLMHRRRRDAFVEDELRWAAEEYRRQNLESTRRHIAGDAWTQFLFYGLIGFAMFALKDLLTLSADVLTSYLFGLLYMMTPTWSMIGAMPAIHRGSVALESIESLGDVFSGEPARQTATTAPIALMRPIELREVTFNYDDTCVADHGFHFGPMDFRLSAGELVFIVGGNGSGKSTFLKLLVGLYAPVSGEIWFDGERLTEPEIVRYREQFSVVFADFHLFNKLLGLEEPDLSRKVQMYLELLQLHDKVSLEGDTFSTVNLSQGQRKRLALLVAYIENRPVYVFDEWAADQDPEYKHVFYERLLPDLRADGKAVVVVTHDDRYFHLGDRVIKLDEGRVADTWFPERSRRASAVQ